MISKLDITNKLLDWWEEQKYEWNDMREAVPRSFLSSLYHFLKPIIYPVERVTGYEEYVCRTKECESTHLEFNGWETFGWFGNWKLLFHYECNAGHSNFVLIERDHPCG